MEKNNWSLEIQAPPELHEPIEQFFNALCWKIKHADGFIHGYEYGLRKARKRGKRNGEWLKHYSHEDGERDGVYCSVCREHYYFGGKLMNFCPNCGADMRGKAE